MADRLPNGQVGARTRTMALDRRIRYAISDESAQSGCRLKPRPGGGGRASGASKWRPDASEGFLDLQQNLWPNTDDREPEITGAGQRSNHPRASSSAWSTPSVPSTADDGPVVIERPGRRAPFPQPLPCEVSATSRPDLCGEKIGRAQSAERVEWITVTALLLPQPRRAAQATQPQPRSLARIAELQTEARHNRPREHVVSKVISKRFAGGKGEPRPGLLAVTTLRYPDAKATYLGPTGIGYVWNYVRYASASLEEHWGKSESRLPEAIEACLDGSIFSSPHLVDVIKDILAIHYIRNVYTREILDRIWAQNLSETRRRLVRQYRDRIDMEFYRQRGFYPGGDEARGIVIDEALGPTIALKNEDAFMRESLERLHTSARGILEARRLELCRCTGELLIGDAPLLARSSDGRFGALEDVALNDATMIAMPIDPYHLVSLGDTAVELTLDQQQVDAVNRMQIRVAKDYVYSRPGSGLHEFVGMNIDARNGYAS